MSVDQSARKHDLWIAASGGAIVFVACALVAIQDVAIEALSAFLAHMTFAPLALAGICRGLGGNAAERGQTVMAAIAGAAAGAGIGVILAPTGTPSFLLSVDLAVGLSSVCLGLLIAAAFGRPWRLALTAIAIGAAGAGASIALISIESSAAMVASVTTTAAAVASFGAGAVLGGLAPSKPSEIAVRLTSGWIAAAALLAAGVNTASSLGFTPPIAAATQADASLSAAKTDLQEDELRRVVETLLARVYRAFEHKEEAATYDALAEAVAGETLESLYLQRRRALARASEGGAEIASVVLERSTLVEADRSSGVYQIDAAWEVVGIVGHATHQHIRRNVYQADVTVAAIDGAWRIRRLDLSDVRRETTEDVPLEDGAGPRQGVTR